MTRCDHCRQTLGARIHRYWQMRFCSQACTDAYRRRLSDETRVKIRLLDREEAGFGRSKYGWLKHGRGELHQHLPRLFAR